MRGLELIRESEGCFGLKGVCSCAEVLGGRGLEWVGDFTEVRGGFAELGGEGFADYVAVGHEGLEVCGEDFAV